ncbi:MAG: DUF3791 domain-containing protein [Candidatus Ancillula sp.]|jgi:hypothetical protein|nr:DUF3791 domain-containing protein [Candidatus Ancillula sp.]
MSEANKRYINRFIEICIRFYSEAHNLSYSDSLIILRELGVIDYIVDNYLVIGHAEKEQIISELDRIVAEKRQVRKTFSNIYA